MSVELFVGAFLIVLGVSASVLRKKFFKKVLSLAVALQGGIILFSIVESYKVKDISTKFLIALPIAFIIIILMMVVAKKITEEDAG